ERRLHRNARRWLSLVCGESAARSGICVLQALPARPGCETATWVVLTYLRYRGLRLLSQQAGLDCRRAAECVRVGGAPRRARRRGDSSYSPACRAAVYGAGLVLGAAVGSAHRDRPP